MWAHPVTKALMFMGTGSDVGKSLLVAGLCRAFKNKGLSVAPFKPQNMSNNAAVTVDGGEIGRAQALQARAAGLEPHTNMNPVLLKPEHESGAQVVVRGQRVGSMPAKEYFAKRAQYKPDILATFSELSGKTDLILVEGAGSASEINLRHNDLANFGFAEAFNIPVILIGDIQRGGVIASIIGTLDVIAPDDAALVCASLINKFQGDPELFEDGRKLIEEKTGRPCLGPVPFFSDAYKLPAEDVLGLDTAIKRSAGNFKIVVPRLSRIANFDDLDPLRAEPDVDLEIIHPGNPLPRDADLVIIPGSKSTCADMDCIKANGWDIDILAHVRAGGAVLGLCGGYQMLGKSIADPDGLEGARGETPGLGLLDVTTILAPEKQLRVEQGAHVLSGEELTGYHIHMGRTEGVDCARPFAKIGNQAEGAVSANGRVMGTYLHGLFAADGFRRNFLQQLGGAAGDLDYEASIDRTLDALATHLERHLDLDSLLAMAGEVGT